MSVKEIRFFQKIGFLTSSKRASFTTPNSPFPIPHSYLHFNQIREQLNNIVTHLPSLPRRKADYWEYGRVHSAEYLEKLSQMAEGKKLDEYPNLSFECSGLEFCLPGYQYGLGSMMAAIDEMKMGKLERAYCFSLAGHHAHPDWGHGYCLLNPLAAAARYAQQNGFPKVLIVDWDIHHGDGTQEIFENDSSIYCISIHSAIDLYISKVVGAKYGTTTYGEQVGHCNIPVLDRSFDDDFFAECHLLGTFYRAVQSIDVFEEKLANMPWSPDLIGIFSGYDSHIDDCGGEITDWNNEDFKKLTRAWGSIPRLKAQVC
jgi:acetoin utilization deacetylase AcuC-like enzyme